MNLYLMYYRGIHNGSSGYIHDTYEYESFVLADSLDKAREKVNQWCIHRHGYPPSSCLLKKQYIDRTGTGIYG